MPFKSEQQRKFLWAAHPDIAKRWAHEYPTPKNLPKRVSDTPERDKQAHSAPIITPEYVNKLLTSVIFQASSEKQGNSGIKLNIPHSEKPVAAGDEHVTTGNKRRDKQRQGSSASIERLFGLGDGKKVASSGAPEYCVNPLLLKLAVVLSQPIQQALADEQAQQQGQQAQQVPANGGIQPLTTPLSANPLPLGAQQQAQPPQPGQPAQQVPMQPPQQVPVQPAPQVQQQPPKTAALATGLKPLKPLAMAKPAVAVKPVQPKPAQKPIQPLKPLGDKSNPSANPINAFGPISMSGVVNGNAALGAPGAGKMAAAGILKIALDKWAYDVANRRQSTNVQDSRVLSGNTFNIPQIPKTPTVQDVAAQMRELDNYVNKVDRDLRNYTAAGNQINNRHTAAIDRNVVDMGRAPARTPQPSTIANETQSAVNRYGPAPTPPQQTPPLTMPQPAPAPAANSWKGEGTKMPPMFGQPRQPPVQPVPTKPAAWRLDKQALNVTKGGLGSRALASTIGHVGGFPMMAIMSRKSHVNPNQWEGPDGDWLTSNISAKDTRAQKLTELAKSMEKTNPEELKDHRVYLGGGDFFRELPRIFTNPRTSIVGKAVGTLTHPINTLLPALTRGSIYNPFTNSTYLMGDKPSVLTHELGHAIDFNSSKVPQYSDKESPAATWLKRQGGGLKHDLYAAGRGVPLFGAFHALHQEEQANTLSEDNLRKTFKHNPEALNKILDERQRVLPAGIGSYMGNAAALSAAALASSALGPAGYMIMPTAGMLAGKAWGEIESRRRAGKYERETKPENKPEKKKDDKEQAAERQEPLRKAAQANKSAGQLHKQADDGLSMAPVYGALLGAAGGAIGNAFRNPGSWGDVGRVAAYATGNDDYVRNPGEFPFYSVDAVGRDMAAGAILGGGAGIGYDALKLMFGKNKAEAEMPEEIANGLPANKSASQLHKQARPLGLDNYSSFAGPDQIQNAVQQYGQLKALVRPDDTTLRAKGLNRNNFQSALRHIVRNSQGKDHYNLSQIAPDPTMYAGLAAGVGAAATAGLGYLGGMNGVGAGLVGTGVGTAAAYLHAVNKRKHILNTAKLMKDYGLLKPKLLSNAYPLLSDDTKFAGLEEFATKAAELAVDTQSKKPSVGEAMYIAGLQGNDAWLRAAKQYADIAHKDAPGGLREQLAPLQLRGLQLRGRTIAHQAVSPVSRMVSDALGSDNIGGALINTLGAIGGGPEVQDKVRKMYAASDIDSHRDKPREGAEPTKNETTWHKSMQGVFADKDYAIAGHAWNRKNHPLQYWLNPLIRTGPLSELSDRLMRRNLAGVTEPETTGSRAFRASVPLMGEIMGGQAAQDKLRAAASAANLYKAAMRDRSPVIYGLLGGAGVGGLAGLIAPGHQTVYDKDGTPSKGKKNTRLVGALSGALTGAAVGGMGGKVFSLGKAIHDIARQEAEYQREEANYY